jgi:hypothetical protein
MMVNSPPFIAIKPSEATITHTKAFSRFGDLIIAMDSNANINTLEKWISLGCALVGSNASTVVSATHAQYRRIAITTGCPGSPLGSLFKKRPTNVAPKTSTRNGKV